MLPVVDSNPPPHISPRHVMDIYCLPNPATPCLSPFLPLSLPPLSLPLSLSLFKDVDETNRLLTRLQLITSLDA